jgi:hypothetical protein
MVRLAVAASSSAALSSRGEVYPVGMPALVALRHAAGALLGPHKLTPDAIRSRVEGRYPQAERLPDRPALDVLLEQAGTGLRWQSNATAGEGVYVVPVAPGPSIGTSTKLYRPSTHVGVEEVPAGWLEARAFDERLDGLLRGGGFLALAVPSREASRVAHALVHRRQLDVVSLDDLLIDAMLAVANELKVTWSVVLAADRAPRDSADWTRLLRLAERARARVETALLARTTPVVLTDPGLLARYELMSLVTALQAESGRPGRVPATILVTPVNGGGPPTIDGVPVPVPTAGTWAVLPRAWLTAQTRPESETTPR